EEIQEYINYYNNERIKSNLNKMSPIDKISNSLLSKLSLNLSKLLGAVYFSTASFSIFFLYKISPMQQYIIPELSYKTIKKFLHS
ncbi:hypothetical protein BWK59_09520, partial [Flavobacterium davisii]